jgi:hypothetical protein
VRPHIGTVAWIAAGAVLVGGCSSTAPAARAPQLPVPLSRSFPVALTGTVPGAGPVSGTKSASGSLTAVPPLHLDTAPTPAPTRVGTVQRTVSDGAALRVDAEAVIDPLVKSGAPLPRGMRAVGVEVSIANAGPSVYDSSSTGDFSLVLSSGAALPVLVTRGGCATPLIDFERDIEPGEQRQGCVTFAVGSEVTITAIQFDPHAGSAGGLLWAR